MMGAPVDKLTRSDVRSNKTVSIHEKRQGIHRLANTLPFVVID
jgi:hypothetical protein